MQYSTQEFESLYMQTFEPCFRLALSLLHDEEEARDAVHEVFLKLWEAKAKPDNPMAYVIRSVRNSCISRLRHLDIREKIRMKMMLEAPPEDYDPEELVRRDAEVTAAMDRLLTFSTTPPPSCTASPPTTRTKTPSASSSRPSAPTKATAPTPSSPSSSASANSASSSPLLSIQSPNPLILSH